MDENDRFKLQLDDQKKNIFVTQLHDRDDEDHDVSAFPVVKETGGQLLETGINTFQKTLLLKKEVEVAKVDAELERCRQQFRQKMEELQQRKLSVQKKRQMMNNKVAKFDKFIKDNDAKRRRAIQKYQIEVLLKEQKQTEYEQLCEQLAKLKKRKSYLEKKVNQYKRFEEYLLRVIDIMPEDYIQDDDKIKGLMMRHTTLSESNKDLVDNLVHMGDEIEHLKKELDDMKTEHDKRKVSINSHLAKLQNLQDRQQDSNKQEEQQFSSNQGDMRKRRTELGVILMAIDNIAEKCLKRLDPVLEEMTLEEKLQKIGAYLQEREDVAQMAAPSGSTIVRGSAEVHKSKVKKKVMVTG
uniref:Coiled-coil domain-containing protein 42 homolog n=1 Tax=Crassostrea virginica TaxID=6565 RepID=A0A8B8DMK4_CRAVI|nr:coiled-coil domain-containing protein 42 homolog [Crassostrea virginica]